MNEPVETQAHLPRNLGLELVRATEATALSAGRWMGLGRSAEVDRIASQAMFSTLNTIAMAGVIVKGEEGKLPHTVLLTSQRAVGTGKGARVDIAVDPVDGLTQLSKGYPGAISAAAIAPQGAMWAPSPAIYMDKIIVNAEVAPYLVPECLDAPAGWTLALVARAKGVKVSNLTVFLLDRPRHADLIAEIRNAGAHVMLRPDGDIAGALMVCTPRSGVDLLMGIGGITEGLLATCAVKALGGEVLGRLDPQDEDERAAVIAAGYDTQRILFTHELVTSNQTFFAATGITDAPLLTGVIFRGDHAETNSILLRSETGTRRHISAEHLLDRSNDSDVEISPATHS
jgi:fructose-1,6-bisphosphatase II